MTADWVKMRTDIYRDHRVCMMAEIIERENSELAEYVLRHKKRDMTVTRNVTRCATVGALVTLWGVTRHRGKRVGDDLLLTGCGLAVLDDIADLPGIGQAMEAVGWARQIGEGVILPAFFAEYNADPQETKKQNAAERQRRYRENKAKKSDVTRDVTRCATSNIEKNRIEKNRDSNIDIGATRKPETEWDQFGGELVIPEKLRTQAVLKSVGEWFVHLESKDPGKVPARNSPQMQHFWAEANRFGADKILDVISFSIANGYMRLIERPPQPQSRRQSKSEENREKVKRMLAKLEEQEKATG